MYKSRNAIAKWRKDKNISQEKLAEHLGINRPLLSQIESGKVLSTNDMLIKISRYLDCLITDLEIREQNDY